MKQKIFVRLSALMLLTALAFAGCASNQPAASKAEPQEASSGATSSSETAPSEAASSQAASGTFTVYTSVPQTLIDEYKGEFSKKYPELTVNVYQAVTNDILSKLKAEKEAGSIGADIVWVADEASAVLLKEQGYLESYTSTEDAGIPDSMKDKDRSYYGSGVQYAGYVGSHELEGSAGPQIQGKDRPAQRDERHLVHLCGGSGGQPGLRLGVFPADEGQRRHAGESEQRRRHKALVG